MATPTAPTIDDLVEEGLAKAGNAHPSASKLARAKEEWMEEIKNDISMVAKRSRFLQITSHGILTRGQSRYSNPSDFEHDLSLVLLDGDVSGTAQAGSLGSITLAATETVTEDSIVGKDILVTTGTGQASLSQVTAYDTSTKVATVTPNFNVAPSSGSGYLVVTQEYPIDPAHVRTFDLTSDTAKARPTHFAQIGDEDYGEFVFNCPPDKAYGARLRYYADIGKLDLNGTHISTLYYKWQNLWKLGIKYRELAENDDSLKQDAEREYKQEIGKIISNQYGLDLNALQATVVDYRG